MIAQCSQDLARARGYNASVPNPRGDRSTPPEIPILLPRGAFLVECSSSERVTDDQLSGRVEHIVSGRATSFDSASKLIDFMRRMLAIRQVNAGAGDVSAGRHEPDGSDSKRSR
jgi:hypothetical protein